MKKMILTLLVVSSMVLASSAAFAGQIVATQSVMIGSTSPTVYKTSPKVTLNVSLTAGTKAAEWAAIALHASAVAKAKGNAYFTASDNPGTYAKPNPVAADATNAITYTDAASFTMLTGFVQEN